MQMEGACTIAVYVHVYIICTWRHIADVSGAAARMQRLCGAYAVAVGVIAHELVVACSACARAL